MIDWAASLRCAAALVAAGDRLGTALSGAQRDAPVFRNRDFPLSPLPLLLDEVPARAWAADAERYVALLDRIIEVYRHDVDVRHWYGLGPEAERLVLADDGGVAVCRLDGYLRQGSERMVLLENNADAPAGTLFTTRVNRVVGDVLTRVGVDVGGLSTLTYDDGTALREALLRQAPDARHLAILQPDGKVSAESAAMAEAFSGAGVEAYVADPRSVRVIRGRVYFGDRPADVCWNKVNTAPWRAFVAADPVLVDRWVEAVSQPSFTHVNPFGARYVAESKQSLALPTDPMFTHLFTDAERELATRLLPPSRRATKDDLDDLLDRPFAHVLKEPYDIRGDGVTIGRSTPRETWRRAVDEAVEHGHLIQVHVAPVTYPVLCAEEPTVVPMPISVDTFVLGGRVRGFGSKASLHDRVNVFQGGRKLAAFVVGAGDAS